MMLLVLFYDVQSQFHDMGRFHAAQHSLATRPLATQKETAARAAVSYCAASPSGGATDRRLLGVEFRLGIA